MTERAWVPRCEDDMGDWDAYFYSVMDSPFLLCLFLFAGKQMKMLGNIDRQNVISHLKFSQIISGARESSCLFNY